MIDFSKINILGMNIEEARWESRGPVRFRLVIDGEVAQAEYAQWHTERVAVAQFTAPKKEPNARALESPSILTLPWHD